MLSSSICIISIVRLWIMSTQLFGTDSTDFTWLFNDSSTWTAVETNIGIVSGVFSLCLEKSLEFFLAES